MDRRRVQMNFRVSEAEADLIRKKMAEVGIRSPGAYLRKMALDGYCVRLEIQDIKEVIFLLRNATNNLNQ
ncbi:MAG: plasmid mobilization relaxosome protein MobC, partial [Pseudobutyrivibrio sp.]|nr:plasmid mobilization relaxosome protein MobC [Pseudobutyrivibrio sp.]